MMEPVVQVEMFLDVSCPWCHGALETNRQLLDELASDPSTPRIDLHWRFMRLHDMPRDGGLPVDEYFASFGSEGTPRERVDAAQAGVDEFCSSVGVRVDWSRYTFLHDPFTAHRLLALVRDDDGADLPSLWSLARAIFSANFVQGVDMSDHASLRGAVERFGLVLPLRIWEALADPQAHSAQALADHARALEVALDGVPRMVIDGTIVPMWLDRGEVRTQLREALASATATTA